MAVQPPAVPDAASRPAKRGDRDPVNDFSIVVATANGTGSQTANLTLLRSFFRMGIPVHGKNIFPSNIQGLPTWYHIRVSKEGFVARTEPEVLVAFNPATMHDDLTSLAPGGVAFVNGDLGPGPDRDDILVYEIPVKDLIADADVKGKLKDYIANMTYVGVVAWSLGIPLDVVDEALDYHFGHRRKLVDTNMAVVRGAYEWAEQALEKVDDYRVEPMNATDGLILMTGNEAAALGAVFGGVTVGAWYPITPSTGVIDALRNYLAELRVEDGKATYSVIQAEDELAAIGMCLGAGWAGARAMTATSGPGLSLMSEFAGLGYFAEIPSVIWDIQRVGPSTGLPTRTSQGDVTFVYHLGHGDTQHVLLFPSTIEECFEFGWKAFDLADELQTPVFVLSDLDLGMNNWMGEPFDYPDEPMKRGKVLSAEEVEAKGFHRYRDLDGDGIGYRTLPGTQHPGAAYFTRGTGHNDSAVYSERSDDWVANSERLARKFETARGLVPKPVVERDEGAVLGIIGFGTTRHAINEARARLRARGIPTDYLRLRALPLTPDVGDFIDAHETVVVVEMNQNGQLRAILRDEMPERATKLQSGAFLDGMPFTAATVLDLLAPHLGGADGDPSASATPSEESA